MKSRISFFNKTVFLKNIKLYFPISLIYFLLLVFLVPVSLFFGFASPVNYLQNRGTASLRSGQYESLVNSLDLETHLVLIIIVAIVIVMAMFSYLFNSKSCNMIHALPITRKELFGTNVISGIVLMMVPQIITFVIAQIVLLIKQFSDIKILGIWFISVLAISFFALSMGIFCAMFTGQLFAVPVYYVIINILYVGIRQIIEETIDIFLFGTNINTIDLSSWDWLSPFYYLARNVSITQIYDEDYAFSIGAKLYGGEILLVYFIISVVLLLIAYLIYRRKPVENTGDLLTISFVKPIFRWGVGFCVGYTITVFLIKVCMANKRSGLEKQFFPLILLFGIVAFFIADMFIAKSFKVFKKMRLLEGFIFSATLAVSFGVFYNSIHSVSGWVPDKDDIERCYVTAGYNMELSGDEIDDVLKFHQNIIDNYIRWNTDYETDIFEEVKISYLTNTGDFIQRYYNIPSVNAICEEMYAPIQSYREGRDKLRDYLIGKDEDNKNLTLKSIEIQYTSDETADLETASFYKQDMEKLYNAFEKDIAEGNFDKEYFSYKSVLEEMEDDDYYYDNMFTIILVCKVDNPSEYSDIHLRSNDIVLDEFIEEEVKAMEDMEDDNIIFYYDNNEYIQPLNSRNKGVTVNKYITFTPDCKNIMETLKSLGLNIL